MRHKVLLLFYIMFFNTIYITAKASQDSIPYNSTLYTLTPQKLIIPTIALGYGVSSITFTNIKQINNNVRSTVSMNFKKSKIDELTQFAPTIALYGLNFCKVKAEHDLLNVSIIYVLSQLTSLAIVRPLKYSIKEMRPDGSNYNSFPSGHTALAFSTAHILFREYKNKNLFLSLVGYPFAVTTGFYRIVNDKHWFGDVIAGAGIGILSTEIAYYLYPYIKKRIFKEKSISITSSYNSYQKNIGFIISF